MKKKICFIINPISGIGKQKGVESLIKEYCSVRDFEIEIKYTKAPKHASVLSREAALAGFDIVVAVGGDGSVNEVSKGLLNSKTSMAILPAGSGNGLARHLAIPLDLKKAMQLIIEGKSKKTDTAEINGNHFINIAGIGFDAHIAHRFAAYGKRGFLSYIKIVIGAYFSYKEHTFKLTIDGKEYTKNALLLSFANGSQFGNNAFISPGSQVNDGVLELCVLRKIPFYALPYFAFQLFTKRAIKSKYLEIIPVKELKLISVTDKIHIDGEPVIAVKEFGLKINPLSVSIIVP